MKKITFIMMGLLILFISKSFTQESGKISIHSEVNPLTMADITSAHTPNKPASKIGFRINTSDTFGIEVTSGLIYNSGNEMDSLSNTEANPGAFVLLVELTAIYKIMNGEKATLSLYTGVGLSFQEWSTMDYWTNDYTIYEEYNVLVPSFFIGLEPEYLFSKNFSIFSKFGVNLSMIPNSKKFVHNYSEDTTELVEKVDSKTLISTDGLSIGLRYYF